MNTPIRPDGPPQRRVVPIVIHARDALVETGILAMLAGRAVVSTEPAVALIVADDMSDKTTTWLSGLASLADVPVGLITSHITRSTISTALRAGVSGVIAREDLTPDNAARMLHSLANGRVHLTQIHLSLLLQGVEKPPTTDRQLEILRLVAKGMTTHRIAVRLGISENVVQTDLSKLMNLWGVHNRSAAVAYAGHHGLL